jgi:hypothetical protein
MGISIFIDSMMIRVSPSSTLSPTAALIFQMVPVMWALISVAMTDSFAGGHRQKETRRPTAAR